MSTSSDSVFLLHGVIPAEPKYHTGAFRDLLTSDAKPSSTSVFVGTLGSWVGLGSEDPATFCLVWSRGFCPGHSRLDTPLNVPRTEDDEFR